LRSTLNIREATPADADALARLRYEFRGPCASGAEPEDEFVERCARWLDDELAREDGWRCWVLTDGDEMVGHLWLCEIRKIPNPAPDEPEHHAYISNFFIRDEYRAQREGTRMMEIALDWCGKHDIDSVVLWPTTASRSLYVRYGFVPPERLLELRLPTSAT
jgi:GNAT superfamily N-acetyltransferase